MSAKFQIKTVILVIIAVGLFFVLFRPDLHFTLDLLAEAFYKNIVGLFTILPAVIAYYSITTLTKPTTDSSLSFEQDTAGQWAGVFKFIQYVAIIAIACIVVSLFAEVPNCDEFGDCGDTQVVTETQRLVNFLRMAMAALVGMIAALAQKD